MIINFKRCFIISILCIAIMLTPFSVFALDYKNELPEDMDTNALSEEILDFMKTTPFEQYEREITDKDIFFSKAFKFYVDTNIFELETNNFESIKSELEKGIYIFEIPIIIGNDIYIANISRRLPLEEDSRRLFTEEEFEEHNKRVGEWVVTAYFGYDTQNPFEDYYEIGEKYVGISDTAPLLIGGLPYFRDPIIVYPDKDGNLGKFVPTKPKSVDWEALGIDNKEKVNMVLDYSEIKETISKLPAQEFSKDEAGGLGSATVGKQYNSLFVTIFIIGLLLCLILIIKFILYRKKMKNIAPK